MRVGTAWTETTAATVWTRIVWVIPLAWLILIDSLVHLPLVLATDSTNTTTFDEASPELLEALQNLFVFTEGDTEDSSVFVNDGNSTFSNEGNRKLQKEWACDEVIASYDLFETMALVTDFIDKTISSTWQAMLLKAAIIPQIHNGVQVRKICGACTDFGVRTTARSIGCKPTDYGSDVTHSGLALIPTWIDGSILWGTHTLSIYGHGTRASEQPSTSWYAIESPPEELFNFVITAVHGVVSILPDYMGYGESLGEAKRGYIIKKSYQTSTLPLVLRMQRTVKQETNCRAAVAKSALVMGYSEGGYAAIAIAESLKSLNYDIIKVEAGGGPYAISSIQLLVAQRRLDEQSFPLVNIFYLALLGASYSSTYKDLPNFRQQSNMLKGRFRRDLVKLVNTGATSQQLNNAILELAQYRNPARLLKRDMVKFTRMALEVRDDDPCADPPNPLLPDRPDAMCRALKEQDLTETILEADYDIRLCHSRDDVLVDVLNIPFFYHSTKWSQNPHLSYNVIGGSHEAAGASCLTEILLYLQSPAFRFYPVADRHSTSGTCS